MSGNSGCFVGATQGLLCWGHTRGGFGGPNKGCSAGAKQGVLCWGQTRDALLGLNKGCVAGTKQGALLGPNKRTTKNASGTKIKAFGTKAEGGVGERMRMRRKREDEEEEGGRRIREEDLKT